MITGRVMRGILLLIGLAWIGEALSFMVLWNTDTPADEGHFAVLFVSIIFWASAVLVLLFTAVPRSNFLYTFAGALSAVAIAARVLSLIGAAVTGADYLGAISLTISKIIITAVLLGLFWWFWQIEVKLWHREQS